MSTDRRDLVSIIIPTYYRNEELQGAIETAVQQDHEPVEVIVVDDSGDRHAESVARDYDVTYVSHTENRGANAARNTGIDRAAGHYVQLLDDDDRLSSEKVRKQLEVFRTTTDVGVVYCGVEHDVGGVVLPPPAARGVVLDRALTFDLSPCMTSTMLLDRGVIDEVYPLKHRPSADDLGFMIELAQITRFDFVDEPLVVKRVSDQSRGQGLTNAWARLSIIQEYEHLYDEFPSRLRDEVLSETYHRIGAQSLNEHFWSATAVWAYWKALRHDPSPGFNTYLGCLVALFGRPGRTVANRVRRWTTE